MIDENRNLEAQLAQKQRELDIVVAIDHIRDTVPEPAAMLESIARLMAEQFDADLCLMFLADRESGKLELKAINERGLFRRPFDVAGFKALSEQIVAAEGAALWSGEQVPAALRAVASDLYLAAVPIVMGKAKRLGGLLLVRANTPFDAHDLDVLRTAENQIDSAVVQGYHHHDLKMRNAELETIYKIDNIRDQHLSFDEMLTAVLQELRGVIHAEMDFIMLYSRVGHRLELRAVVQDDLFQMPAYHNAIDEMGNEALRRGELICQNDLERGICSMMCMPLMLQDEIIGVLGVVNSYRPGGFNADDRRLLTAIGSQMDTAIFETLERRRLREVLGRSVDPRVMERLLENLDTDFLKGERLMLSVLYSDIRGSTSLAERTNPEPLVGFVNDYLGQMTDVILSHEGTLDKFVGDEVMALFGAPFPMEGYAMRAVRAALDMQFKHQQIMARWRDQGVDAAPIGIGIATGELIAGEMGCPRRTDYTVIGRAANLGARICSAASPGQILICQATYDLVMDKVEAVPIHGLRMKGVDAPVTVYNVTHTIS
jgi:class 3 adenylate cyclase